MKKLILTLIVYSATLLLQAQKPVLYLGADIHTAAGNVIKNGAMAVKNGRIEWLAQASTIRIDSSAFEKIVRLNGKRIYPGFIVLNSTLGITEIDAVRATVDFNETGLLNPNVRTQIAFNAESEIIKTVRSNGVLMAQVAPQGGLASGFSSVMKLEGWNWEDATIQTDDALHIQWPHQLRQWQTSPDDTSKPDKYRQQRIRELYTLFEDARAYKINPQSNDVSNSKLNALSGIIEGKQALFIHASDQKSIREALQFFTYFAIKKPVLAEADESLLVLDLIKASKVKVVLGRSHRLPAFSESAIDEAYQLPYLLTKEGIEVSITNTGDMEAMGTRNLSYNAGTAKAYGLSDDEALKTITLNPARCVGIDKDFGSIEQGKWANFIVTSGDVFDMKSSKVEQAYFKGQAIDLNNKQKELYRKYEQKYGLEHQE